MSIIPIVDYVESKIVKKVEIEIVNYNINTNAVCNVNFLDVSGTKISSVLVYIENEDFNTNWVNDSNLISIVLSKLDLFPLPSNK